MASCGCDDSDSLPTESSLNGDLTEARQNSCTNALHKKVCIQAKVTIDPIVEMSAVSIKCLGGPIFGGCPGTPAPKCEFTIGQALCVDIPLRYSANVRTTPCGITCGMFPKDGPCSKEDE